MSPLKYDLSNSYVEAEFTLHGLVDGLSHFITIATIWRKGYTEVQANLSPETWQKAYYIPKMCVTGWWGEDIQYDRGAASMQIAIKFGLNYVY